MTQKIRKAAYKQEYMKIAFKNINLEHFINFLSTADFLYYEKKKQIIKWIIYFFFFPKSIALSIFIIHILGKYDDYINIKLK